MVQKVNFSQNVLQSFSEILGGLKEACCPPVTEIQPNIYVAAPMDYVCDDCYGLYTVAELNQMVRAGQVLPSHIGTVKVDGEVWFYSTENPFDFYSTKNYVTLDFAPQRLINPKVLKDKTVFNSIKKMLALIGQGKVSDTELQKVFSEDVCRKVYEISSPREYILSAMKDAIEPVRRHLVQHLRAHHENDIRQLPEFQSFLNTHPNLANPINEFLKADYKVFSLAEDWGYIANSKKLKLFQQLRDVPRHPSKLMPCPLDSPGRLSAMSDEDWNKWAYHRGYPYQNPQELFNDFQKALFFVTPKKQKDTVPFDDAVCSTWAQQDIEQLKLILSSFAYRDKLEKFLQNTFPEEVSIENVTIEKADQSCVSEPVTRFSSFYIRKKGVALAAAGKKQKDGSLLFEEDAFHNWQKISNTSAHVNEGYQESAKILSEDMIVLSDFVTDLKNATRRKRLSQIRMGNPKKSIGQQSSR